MAKKDTDQVQEPSTASPAGASPEAPARGPQGITVRHMNTGNPVLDFHKKHRKMRKIDPASLLVDGKDPALALPIEGSVQNVRIRRVAAEHAADMLLCDFQTGGQSIYRLATDEEVAKYEADLAARATPAKK